jgi:tetratricopeptide (TPR) repeat protein
LKVNHLIINLLINILIFASVSSSAQLNKSYFFNQGRYYLSQEQFTEAISTLNQLIKVDTTIAEAWFLRGVAKYYLNDLHGALADFTKSINHNPVYSQAYFYRAVVNSRFSKFSQAFLDYEMAIDLRPNSPDAFYSRGITYLMTLQAEKAIKDFTQVIKHEPKNIDAWLNRGTAHLMNFDTLNAFSDYNYAIPLNPFNAEPYSKRGRLFYDMGNYEEALNDLSQAISLDERSSINFFIRGLTYNELNNIDGAIADLDRAIDLSPDNALSIYNRALMHWKNGDTKAALIDFERVTALNPENVLVHFNRGILFYEMDKYVEALHNFSTAIEIFPDFAKAYLARSAAYARMGNHIRSERDRIFAQSIAERYANEHSQPFTDTSVQFNNLIAFSADFSTKSNIPSLDGYDSKPIDILPFIRVVLVQKTKLNTLGQDFEPIDSLNSQLAATDLRFTFGTANDTTDLILIDITDFQPFTASFIQGMHQSAEGKFNRAAEQYQQALRVAPENPLALLNLSVEKAEMVNFIASFDKEIGSVDFIKPSRRNERSTASTGIQLISFDESIKLLNRLEAIIPNHHVVYYNKGNIFALAGDINSAIILYTKAIERNPNLAEAWYNRGLIHLMQKQTDVACSDLGKAGELGIRQAYLLIHRFCRK